EQRRIATRARSGEVLHDFGDLLAVRHGGVHPLLGLDDARRGDELHRARDLLRGLDAANASPKNSLLPSSHYCLPRSSALRFSSLGCASSLALPSARAGTTARAAEAKRRRVPTIIQLPGSCRSRPRRLLRR